VSFVCAMIETRHSELFRIWNALCGRRRMPRVGDMAPGAIAPHLRDLLIIEQRDDLSNRIRLAGTAVCDLFGRELSGLSIGALWRECDRPDIERIAAAIFTEANPVVLGALGHAGEGPPRGFGCILLPVEAEKDRPRRIIGSLRPREPGRPPSVALRELQMASLRILDRERPRSGLHAAGLRRSEIALQRGHLTLLRGGNIAPGPLS
jgi:hypothetical protein